jgi:hypothetical protein
VQPLAQGQVGPGHLVGALVPSLEKAALLLDLGRVEAEAQGQGGQATHEEQAVVVAQGGVLPPAHVQGAAMLIHVAGGYFFYGAGEAVDKPGRDPRQVGRAAQEPQKQGFERAPGVKSHGLEGYAVGYLGIIENILPGPARHLGEHFQGDPFAPVAQKTFHRPGFHLQHLVQTGQKAGNRLGAAAAHIGDHRGGVEGAGQPVVHDPSCVWV